MARVNAVSLDGSPELQVAAWHFLREYYLRPTPPGMFYKHGTVESPEAHYQIIYDWCKWKLSVVEAPRGMAKSTLVREHAIRKMLTQPYYEIGGFYSGIDSVKKSVGIIKRQFEENSRIIDDFGKLRGKRGSGQWNNETIQLRNGATFTGRPIRGAVLGMRPNEIFLDDVERDDSLIQDQKDLSDAFREFFFNAIFPMAEEATLIRVIGTIVNARTFIHWLETTNDPRIADFWHRILYKAEYTDEGTGERRSVWEEKMSLEWLDGQLAKMGAEAYGLQYMNEAGRGTKLPLKRHPYLTSYWLNRPDEEAISNPFASDSDVVTHQLTGWEENPDTKERVPVYRQAVRPWSETLQQMRRFITIDYALTEKSTSDFSCIHVMGLENSEVHRNTLWSLDLWLGKVPRHKLVRIAFELARKWHVYLIGIEAYPLQTEYFERMDSDLAPYLNTLERPPAVVPLRFPPRMTKPEKLATLVWRFEQFAVKLPAHRASEPGYRALNYQIDHYTSDLKLLQHDDAIETLAMAQAIGKQRAPTREQIVTDEVDPLEEMKKGNFTDEVTGMPYALALDWTKVSTEDLDAIAEAHYDAIEQEGVSEWVTGPFF